ncbi:YqaJ viral recombinase family protein [Campylobacter coli]|uniref:lambda exonuclease family protein n=1 Tax=Campylobacter coli TaxID=195 RepID=UPI001D0E9601|nr:lambda exonuclease family protein [Campylobacter coli]MCC2555277.1 YqaJ viral recombinase family protein [Campylobacter coli]MCC2556371.1 YqaJ viral recombinase family protein [Campylobacter coli]MCG4078583.1 YqaJ viral recombinase family protein [Campylobacter coli]MCG4079658.1 YqaJ viral recombinase family protein [Campylobacter coli]
MSYKIIDLEQGSGEWLNFRKGKIGASMVPSCVGIKGAFSSKEEARDIILGLKEVYQNEAMRRGNEYEPLIRARVEFLHSVSITPVVLQSLENEMFIASLDGIDENGVIYEFKYSQDEYDFIKRNKKPSDKYYAQVQFQLYISGKEKCIFVAINKEEEIVECEVLRDEAYQEWLIKSVKQFILDYIINQKSDYKDLDDNHAKELTIEIIRLENTIKPIKEKLESLKKELIALANGEKARCLDITIYPQIRTTIDYKGFLEFAKLEVPREYMKQTTSMCLKIKKGA